MPLFRLSLCCEEWRIMNLMGRSGARWDTGTGRTDHFCAGRDGGQLIFDPLGSSQARGVTAALSLAPHLNLNSILWCSYAPTWQASGVICSAQNAEPFFLCALTEIWVIKVKWNALEKKNPRLYRWLSCKCQAWIVRAVLRSLIPRTISAPVTLAAAALEAQLPSQAVFASWKVELLNWWQLFGINICAGVAFRPFQWYSEQESQALKCSMPYINIWKKKIQPVKWRSCESFRHH